MRALFLALSTSAAVAGGAATALADTTVRWLHIEQNPQIAQWWEEVAAEFEKKNPDVDIQMQFLENEAYKAKLTTILQSDDRPDIFYTWGGGVLHAQIDAGVVKDITDAMRGEWEAELSPTSVRAMTYKDRVYGVPMMVSQVGFWYNKELMQKAGVDPQAIKTWDDLLAAVKKLKEAGVTPLTAGGADKWPLHFYWTHLALRLGGEEAFKAATNGEGDGFASEPFVKAGELMQQLTALEPFQDGYLSFTNQQSAGYFGDGKAAMALMGNWGYQQHITQSASGKGLPDEQIGWFEFPLVEGGKGKPTDTLGGVNGWVVTKDAPPEAVEFLRFFINAEHQREMGRRGYYIPVAKGAEAEMTNPFYKRVAENIAASTYHQIFYDQMLGPSVGRVVNDVSADLAAGNITPEEAAQTVQEAWEFAN
jgi:raffinose/stachyose/melibiose transport system substrate-binding protein